MQSFDDDQDSGDGSSEDEQQNDRNEQMNEVEEPDPDEDPDPEEEEEEGDGDSDEQDETMNESQQPGLNSRTQTQSSNADLKSGDAEQVPTSLGETPVLAPTSHPQPTVTLTAPSPQSRSIEQGSAFSRLSVRPEALAATTYDIVPTIAAPHSTSINVVTATPDLRWVFTGGSDGYIRRFNWVDTANGKLMLTVAQRHPFVDSVTKAGVLASYWENEEPQARPGDDGSTLSPVYSLAVHSQSLWLLSGLDSGGINLQSVRHDEGKRIHCLRKHTSAVSVLVLAQDETSVLSGSWDKTVLDWDLHTGSIKRTFDGSGGQVSALEMRPESALAVPSTGLEQSDPNGTMSSDNDNMPRSSDGLPNGDIAERDMGNADGMNASANPAMSPVDSLFGGNDNDSLFGGDDGAPSANYGDDDDDEFSRAIATNGIQQQGNEDGDGDVSMADVGATDEPKLPNGTAAASDSTAAAESQDQKPGNSAETNQEALTNGLPHAEELESSTNIDTAGDAQDKTATADTTFLAASIDGSIRVWDKRQSNPIAKIVSKAAPPWCMSACWSPDGNFIYAGRRNGTVEEFSLHKGLRNVERTFRFPNGSGPVSAVRAMPNGRHIICASYDILRLYDSTQQQLFKHSTVPFLIVPGHRTGVVSQLYLDPTCRFMISTAGNRGWEGNTTQVLLGYEVNI